MLPSEFRVLTFSQITQPTRELVWNLDRTEDAAKQVEKEIADLKKRHADQLVQQRKFFEEQMEKSKEELASKLARLEEATTKREAIMGRKEQR